MQAWDSDASLNLPGNTEKSDTIKTIVNESTDFSVNAAVSWKFGHCCFFMKFYLMCYAVIINYFGKKIIQLWENKG